LMMHQPHSNLGQCGMWDEQESWLANWTNVKTKFHFAFWKNSY
jgi:hypothetical protein